MSFQWWFKSSHHSPQFPPPHSKLLPPLPFTAFQFHPLLSRSVFHHSAILRQGIQGRSGGAHINIHTSASNKGTIYGGLHGTEVGPWLSLVERENLGVGGIRGLFVCLLWRCFANKNFFKCLIPVSFEDKQELKVRDWGSSRKARGLCLCTPDGCTEPDCAVLYRNRWELMS